MTAERITELRAVLGAEAISLDELIEIESAFNEIPDSQLDDLRENALAGDMLNELEKANK
jgi:hypothetical protein